MAKYRKIPVIVEAFLWSEEHDGVMMRPPDPIDVDYDTEMEKCYVTTIHGDRAYLENGDWIIKEPDGVHFYPCKPDIFEATYEPVPE